MYADVHRRVDMRKKEVDVFTAELHLFTIDVVYTYIQYKGIPQCMYKHGPQSIHKTHIHLPMRIMQWGMENKRSKRHRKTKLSSLW